MKTHLARGATAAVALAFAIAAAPIARADAEVASGPVLCALVGGIPLLDRIGGCDRRPADPSPGQSGQTPTKVPIRR